MFFQKNLGDGTPTWVKRRAIEHSTHDNEYPLVNNRATLTWLAQIASLEIHVPQWRFGRNGAKKNPDRMVLDLDPGEGVGLPECAEVARLARTILQGMGLDPMPVTSGSKGIHLYAALDGSQTSDQVSAVAHELARILEADHPDLIVSDMKKTLRDGKVLVDWSQNNGFEDHGRAVFAARPRPPHGGRTAHVARALVAVARSARLHRGARAGEAARRSAGGDSRGRRRRGVAAGRAGRRACCRRRRRAGGPPW